MSEDLVLFRDDKDRLGLIGLHCAHRGTDLSYGRVEDGGLRCLYHGWLFDIHGKCLDQPAEPEDKKFCHKVRQTSYPVKEYGGVIWTYMGEGEAPLIPAFQFLDCPEENRIAFRVVQNCNWLQGLESSIDPSHTSYLHRMAPLKGPSATTQLAGNRYYAEDTNPRLDIEHVSYGVRIHSLRKTKDGGYLRVNNYLYPNGTTPASSEPPPVGGYGGRWYVPIDDEHHARFEFVYRSTQPVDKEALRRVKDMHVGPDKRHVRRAENRYLHDREEQKSNETFCGLGRYIPAHDAFAIETQGAIQDRREEHLGSTDVVIIEARKAILNAIKEIQAGRDAPGLLRDPRQNQFPDFICISDFVQPGEDGPAYCKRVLGSSPPKIAAE